MTTPRKLLVDPVNECDYHLVSRCVRRSYLCGPDPLTGHDFTYRRAWLLDRLRLLVPCFAIDLYAYTVMSNHFHLAVRHDPLACRAWSDAEVAARWFDAFRPSRPAKWWRTSSRNAANSCSATPSGWRGRAPRWVSCRSS